KSSLAGISLISPPTLTTRLSFLVADSSANFLNAFLTPKRTFSEKVAFCGFVIVCLVSIASQQYYIPKFVIKDHFSKLITLGYNFGLHIHIVQHQPLVTVWYI